MTTLESKREDRRYRATSIAAYASSALITLAALAVVLQLWRSDINVPFRYSDDAMQNAMYIKGMIENGWFLTNPRMGAPDGQTLYTLVPFDLLSALMLKALIATGASFGAVLNTFYLASYPLVAIAALFAFRRMGVSRPVGVAMSVLYALAPYHFFRGENHLLLSLYASIPLAAMVALWLADRPFRLRNRPRLSIVLLTCLVLGLGNAYYAAFACYLFMVAGCVGGIKRRSWAPVATATAFTGLVVGLVAATFLPTFLYTHTHHMPPIAVKRRASDSEFMALKLDQMILPVTGHRLGILRDLKQRYTDEMLPTFFTENEAATLGAVGTAGLLALVASLALAASPRLRRMRTGAILAVWCFAFGTIGGLGSLLAMANPIFRSVNRISIVIAFFALYALAYWLDRAARRASRSALTVLVALAALVAFGVWDQTTPANVPPYHDTALQFGQDERFVKAIEATLLPQSMIFQEPYKRFPESGPPLDYDQARGFLHSTSLRWSYGCIAGGEGDAKRRAFEAIRDPVQLLLAIKSAGYAGVWLHGPHLGDAVGFGKMVEGIGSILGERPIASDDGSLVFFDLRGWPRQ